MKRILIVILCLASYVTSFASAQDLENAIANAETLYTVNVGDGPFEIPTNSQNLSEFKSEITKIKNKTISSSLWFIIRYLSSWTNEIQQVNTAISTYKSSAKVNVYTNPTTDLFSLYSTHFEKTLTIKEEKISGNIELSFSEDAGSIYPQALLFEPVSNNVNCFYISYKDANGDKTYFATGTNNNSIKTTTNYSEALSIKVDPFTTQSGIWYLENTASSRYIGNTNNTFYTGNVNYDMSINNAQMAPVVTMSVNSAYQFSTIILPFDYPVPDGVSIYTIEDLLSDGTIVLDNNGATIKANIPYIVYAENGLSSTQIQNYGQAYVDPTLTEHALTGSYAGCVGPVNSYVLSVKNYNGVNVTAFYRLTKETNIPPYRVYFTPSILNNNVKAESMRFKMDYDAVQSVQIDLGNKKIQHICNEAGMILPKLQKGINIVKYTDDSIRKILVQ